MVRVRYYGRSKNKHFTYKRVKCSRCIRPQATRLYCCTVRQLDILDWKDEKTTIWLDCSTASMLPSSDYTSCRRTDREPVPVAVLSSRRPEATPSTRSRAVGELHKMANYFVNTHFRLVLLSVFYLLWKLFLMVPLGCAIVCWNILMIWDSSSGTREFSHGNSTALCLLVSTQRHICTNIFYHSICWCESFGK